MTNPQFDQELARLHHTFNQVIEQLGIHQTTCLLDSFLHNQKSIRGSKLSITLIKDEIIEIALSKSGLQLEWFMESEVPDYRELRMICYHLLYKHGGISQRLIGELFERSKRTIQYYLTKSTDYLDTPRFTKSYCELFKEIETEYIRRCGGKLNNTINAKD